MSRSRVADIQPSIYVAHRIWILQSKYMSRHLIILINVIYLYPHNDGDDFMTASGGGRCGDNGEAYTARVIQSVPTIRRRLPYADLPQTSSHIRVIMSFFLVIPTSLQSLDPMALESRIRGFYSMANVHRALTHP